VCNLCKKNISFNENDSFNNCKKYEENICDKCIKDHTKKNPSQKVFPLKRIDDKKSKYYTN
jgi:hypothetical protein